MAKGEQTFDGSKHAIKKFDFTPVPIAEYDFKLRTSKVAVSVADGVGKLPYLNGAVLELKDSATTEGGKNRTIYARFFIKITPDKDGVVSVNRGDGLNALAKALGVALKGIPVIKKPAKDKAGKDYTALMLDPQKAAAWLKAQDGAVGSCKTKLEKDQNDPDKKWGKVDYFIEAEEGGEEEDEDEDEVDADEDEADDGDEDEEGDDEDEDEDEEVDDEDEEEPVKTKKAKGKKGKK